LRVALVAAMVVGTAGLAAGEAAAKERRLPKSAAEVQLSFAPLVKRVAPAVVNIYTRRVVERAARSPLFDDPFFRQFFGEGFGFGRGRRIRKQQNSLGSGVIVSADGLIVTNHHVIADADEIKVALSDAREFEAHLVLDDEGTDLAVLRIDTEGEDLPFLRLGDSDDLEVGDLVLAIGNPFNVGQTVTSGIVSAVARTGVGISDFQFFIQTDAAINPGNSGGALVTMDGRLVGINTAIFSKSGGSLGIGFAIPAAMARVVVESAKQGLNYVQRPWLGAGTQRVTAEIAQSLGLARPSGALVREIYPGGPADKAGLRVGDVILRAGGRPVQDPEGLIYRIGTRVIGGSLKLDVWRSGKTSSRGLKLVSAPEDPPREVSEIRGHSPLAGATVANLSPALSEELGLDTLMRGVIVLAVAQGSPAYRMKLRRGDLIIKVGGTEIRDVATLKRKLVKPRREWHLSVRRGDRTFNLVLRA
jgi:serine protease Do